MQLPRVQFYLIALIGLTSCWGCSVRPTVSRELAPSVEPHSARAVSDSLESALMRDARQEIRSKLEKALQKALDGGNLNDVLDQIIAEYGKPLSSDYKYAEAGIRLYANGERKPMRRIWYALETAKFGKGSHFLVVEVVPDEESLKIASFSVVSFSAEVPPNLK